MEAASTAPIPTAPAAPITPPTPVGATSPNPVTPTNGKKKVIFMLFGILIVLIVVIGIGYYFLYMKNGTSQTSYVAPSIAPSKSPSPTPEGTITSESDLEGVVGQVNDTSDEDGMNKEVIGLQSDSNF